MRGKGNCETASTESVLVEAMEQLEKTVAKQMDEMSMRLIELTAAICRCPLGAGLSENYKGTDSGLELHNEIRENDGGSNCQWCGTWVPLPAQILGGNFIWTHYL